MTFPAYPDYRDSGVEWLGVVPEHWGVKPLRYLGRFRKGLTITKADLTDIGIPCLNYGEVHSLYPFEVNQDIQALKCVPAEYLETEPSSCISYGDFVFADTSEDLEGVGNFTHVSGSEPLFAGYHTIIYSLDSDVSSRFLAYCLESFAFRTQLRMGVKGVKVFSVTQEILRGGIAWIPTTAEQTQIARFLDHETARIDALIKEQQRLIELLKEKRQAVISYAVTRGLDPTVPMKDSGVEWLGEVPVHWEVSRLKFVTKIIDCKNRTPEYIDDGEYLVVRTSNVKNQTLGLVGALYTDEANFKVWTQRGVPPVGSILFTREAPAGEVCLVPEAVPLCLGQRMMNIIPHDLGCTAFLFDFLTSDCLTRYIESVAHGSTVSHLRVEQIYDIPIAIPPLNEQVQIDKLVSELKRKYSGLISEANQAVLLLHERRSALVFAAVTGKIDVRGWQLPVSVQAPTLEAEAI